MTAEVAIMNKSAIAVAADSAITVGKNKVHRNANKIFQLCDSAPIGAMIYGSAELAGMPWETLIKLFRSEHGRASYSTVSECFTRLKVFLSVEV
jgi:ATP-dependent protease HslVU (ClpYQ) peptidase subunit